MKRLGVLLILLLTIGNANARRRLEIHAFPVPEAQVIDPTHLRRHARNEIEIAIVQQARDAGLLTFHLNGRPIAKLGYADWIWLYLPPGNYRLGVSPSPNFGRAIFWEMKADVSGKVPQVYRIFQSAGFTSSGGNPVYEIARER